MNEIRALTALRGIFAMWVVLYHITMWAETPHLGFPIVSRGYLAVDFFFMLSGFILAKAHSDKFLDYKIRTHCAFIVRRFGRLFPLHLVALTACVALMAIDHMPLYWRGYILDEALLVHRWGFSHSPMATINGPDWSISTEWAANLLFPIFIIIILKNKFISYVSMIISCLVLIWINQHNHGTINFSFARSLIPLERCFAEFAIGVFLSNMRDWPVRLASDKVLFPILIIIVILLIFQFTDLLVVGLMAPLILGLSLSRGKLANLLSYNQFYWLGLVSYSLYLLQYPVILIMKRIVHLILYSDIEFFVFAILTIISLLILSAWSHDFIEKRGQRLVLRLSSEKF